MKVKHLLFSMIAAAFLTSAISFDKNIEVGQQAPKIETIDGRIVGNDANTEGKDKIISFWNPKIPASRIANQSLSQKFGSDSKENIEFISICTDEDRELMAAVMKIDGVEADKCYSYNDISSRVLKDYGVEKTPKAFKISSEGKILEIM